jgi:hypothetical protein
VDRPLLTDRRRAERRQPGEHESLGRVRLRTGRELVVVDLSPTGVLVEGPTRLLPNTHLDVHIVTRTGRVLVRCRVARASVCHVEADAIRYRAALAFDRHVDTAPGYGLPSSSADELATPGSGYPATVAAAFASGEERLSA